MAVFTAVSEDQAQALLDRLGLGRLQALTGIKAGIENSNFFVDAEAGRFVLTVFERLTHAQLPFYLGLMRHLAAKGLPVPAPQADANGDTLFSLAGKPAALVSRLRGGHQLAPDLFHCEQLGHALARQHLAVADFPLRQPNLRGLAWWQQTSGELLPLLDAELAALLQDELQFQTELAASPAARELPQGAIHADLFRDNAMFEGLPGREQLSGVFDFYFAGVDSFLFDLAVCLNDWCIDWSRAGWSKSAPPPWWRPTNASARSPAPSTACCPPCCAPLRCASGSAACTTGTDRAKPACSNPMTRRISSACCARAGERAWHAL